MERKCSNCDELLIKGLAYKLYNGALSVRFDKGDIFEKSSKPIISPYVCKKCGFVEWYVDKPELL